MKSDREIIWLARLDWVDESSVQHLMKNDDVKYIADTKPLGRCSSANDPEILSSTMRNAGRWTAFHIVDVGTIVTKVGVTARETTSSRDH